MNRHGVGADAVVDAAIARGRVRRKRHGYGFSKARTGVAPCRQRQPGVTARTFAGPARFSGRTARCDAVTGKRSGSFMTYPSMAGVQWRRRRFR